MNLPLVNVPRVQELFESKHWPSHFRGIFYEAPRKGYSNVTALQGNQRSEPMMTLVCEQRKQLQVRTSQVGLAVTSGIGRYVLVQGCVRLN